MHTDELVDGDEEDAMYLLWYAATVYVGILCHNMSDVIDLVTCQLPAAFGTAARILG